MRLDAHWASSDRQAHAEPLERLNLSSSLELDLVESTPSHQIPLRPLRAKASSDVAVPHENPDWLHSIDPVKEKSCVKQRRRAVADGPDPSLLTWGDFNHYIRTRSLPWQRDATGVRYAHATSHTDGFSQRKSTRLPNNCRDIALTPQQFSSALQARFAKELTQHACADLKQKSPELSAGSGSTPQQKIILLITVILILACFALWPSGTYVGCTILFYAFCTSFFLLRICCLAMPLDTQCANRRGVPVLQRMAPILSDKELPIYSILIPLYKEGNMLHGILDAINALDYPHDKLDVKLILESDDIETLCAVRSVSLDDRFDIIRVPYSLPQTKPKACNFALPFARGEYVVIFDAEDRPEPDQLRKAASMFAVLPDDVVCQQARLNFYNATENWLTRQFAIEYAVWFGLILPGLYALGLIIPLGGTSNHFRIEALRSLKAWDAYNVTEDADLGVRIATCGLRTVLLTSTTYEEANCRTANWVRQRSRWQKGYLQTWLVHTRRPLLSIGQMGLWKFAGLTLTLLGSVLLGLGPIIGLAIGAGGVAVSAVTDTFSVPVWLAGLSVLLALVGYFVATVSGWIGLHRTGQRGLRLSLASVPLYWVLVSLGTIKGVRQIVTNPFHWEKTEHGLSSEMALPSRTHETNCRPDAVARSASPAPTLSGYRR